MRRAEVGMAQAELQQAVLSILQNLHQSKDRGLKELFWTELNYSQENKPLSPRQWPGSAKQCLADDPTLFATGGEEGAFHVIYTRLAGDTLLRGAERPVVNQLLREHPYALFAFANKSQTAWHFLNVKYDEQAEKRRLVRRITVRHGEGLRTAAERLALLDLQAISPDLFGLSPLLIQQHHDEAFDVEKVTKDFYREIANWYFWALKHVEFPKDAPKEKDGRDHISVIRLITRLIFCWFIRQKGLIPDVLFDRRRLTEMLEGFAPDKPRNADSVFYRAILQNLFFATLNTEMDQRGWRREDQNFMAHCLYRHKDCFHDPKMALGWFKDIPFLNGGLFECLDKDFGEGAKPRYVRVDGFSDRPDSRPTVPDFLFFGPEQEVNLSEDYGDKKFATVRVRGLIDTLDRYKFTIEENTPFDQEVALDPELCGKVFENLLAAYNPETGTTARKATGSFYTPREIVDYMVDESLVAYLKGKLTTEDTEGTEKKLRDLLAYDGEPHGFTDAETEALIDAIDNLKALDPAVGSGAFPMGILHKLVHVLGKLDPDNARWKAKQIAKLDDAVMREEAERIFRENYDNYGRKLYLIENCIYGVDIQPIAVQIAKMRFFISLVVDQKINPAAPNLGVRALPNLETKFVAANTLIGIERPKQMLLRNPEIDKKETELRKVREKHFTAKNLKTKAKCRDDDKRLRAEIADLLKNDDWDNATAEQLAAWDPYDQNASSPFFDPEWMFGLRDGFDIVTGNPPYLESRSPAFTDELKDSLIAAVEQRWKGIDVSAHITRGADLLVYFLETSVALIKPRGNVVLITQNAWLDTDYGKRFQEFLLRVTHVSLVVDSDFKHFDSGGGPNINTVITFFRGRKPETGKAITFARFRDHFDVGVIPSSGDAVSEQVTNVQFRQYRYDSQTLRTTKWGVLLSLDDAALDLLSILEKQATPINGICNAQLTVGQGLNLTKAYFLDDSDVKNLPFVRKALIPILTAADGAPFEIVSTHQHLADARKLSGHELRDLRKSGITAFDPSATKKLPPVLILPRGIGRHFCALNPAKAHSASAVDIYAPASGIAENVLLDLWAVLNSSVTWLLREVTGRKNLGGGMLKAEATDLAALPLYVDTGEAGEIRRIANALRKREADESIAELETEEHRAIDALVFNALGLGVGKRDQIIRSLRRSFAERAKKART
jgi:hypothetical protein